MFLDAINEDVLEWAEAWNAHKVQVPEGGQRSPRDMYIFGMIEDGPRGIQQILDEGHEEEEDIGNPEEYGVDWQAQSDPRVMRHLLDNNLPDVGKNHRENLDLPHGIPTRLSHVECTSPDAPLSDEKLHIFEEHYPDIRSRSMEVRKLLWQQALAFCIQLNPQGKYNTVLSAWVRRG